MGAKSLTLTAAGLFYNFAAEARDDS
uniref:Uncharacterized protein n=1 Tax=Arundo donax TaxID=35708 RepID=A0A0A9A624_ARUDO